MEIATKECIATTSERGMVPTHGNRALSSVDDSKLTEGIDEFMQMWRGKNGRRERRAGWSLEIG
jgi:hypothetical protein